MKKTMKRKNNVRGGGKMKKLTKKVKKTLKNIEKKIEKKRYDLDESIIKSKKRIRY